LQFADTCLLRILLVFPGSNTALATVTLPNRMTEAQQAKNIKQQAGKRSKFKPWNL